MSKNKKPILYVKEGCPWCTEAISFFNAQGVDIDIQDVLRNPDHMDAMINLSGQSKTPTFQYEDFMVADFDVEEFLDELNEFPQIRSELGISEI